MVDRNIDDVADQEEVISPGFSYETRDAEIVELSGADHDILVEKIAKNFDRFDKAKNNARRRWRHTERIVKGAVKRIESERSSALLPYGKQSHQTLIAHFWGRSLQSDNVLFSVYGKDEQSKNHAPTQKEYILELLRADGFQQKLDDGVDDALMKGVVIAHVGYNESKHTIQVLSGYKGTEEQYETDEITGQPVRAFTTVDQTTQDSASLTIIDPEDFVFDTNNHQNWDSCFKVWRRWEEFEDIEAEPTYSNYEGLDEEPNTKEDSGFRYFPKSQSKQKSALGYDEDGRIELLEFHGNIRLPDGTYLRNWTIVVAARKRIIKFERNPYYLNPFIKWQYERADDGWGLSPMDYIVPIVDAASTLLNTGVEAAKININPAWLTPKGMITGKRQYLREGLHIEYEPDTKYPGLKPEKIELHHEVPFPFLQLFESQTEATTGATRQLSGNVTTNDSDQTATEFKGLQIVGNLVIDRIVGRFNLYFKVPVIEKMAQITAMFNPEPTNEQGQPMQVQVQNEKGLRDLQPVTPDITLGNYKYVIDDNKAELERKQNAQQLIGLFTQALNDPEIAGRAKKIEIMTAVLRDLGYEDAPNMFMSDDELVNKLLRDAAIQEQAMIMIGQMQQAARAQALMAAGVDPNAPQPVPQGNEAAPGQAQQPQAGASPTADPGMGAVPSGNSEFAA